MWEQVAVIVWRYSTQYCTVRRVLTVLALLYRYCTRDANCLSEVLKLWSRINNNDVDPTRTWINEEISYFYSRMITLCLHLVNVVLNGGDLYNHFRGFSTGGSWTNSSSSIVSHGPCNSLVVLGLALAFSEVIALLTYKIISVYLAHYTVNSSNTNSGTEDEQKVSLRRYLPTMVRTAEKMNSQRLSSG